MLRKLRIKLENYKVIKFIGKGQFNEVFLVEEKATKKQYAAKVSIQICEDSNKQIQFIKEVEIFSKVDYPTVLHFIGFNPQNFEFKPYPTVITDFIPNGSLETMLKQASLGQAPVKWSETSRYIVLLGSALGMNYLHKKGIIHRDIKPANILLNEDFYPIICDFGFSKFTSERFAEFLMSSQIGTPFYMAPEILRNDKYAFNVDVYSFSLVAFQLITCKIQPFRFDCNLIEGKENQEFFTKCYSLDPLQRPTFYDICFRITKKDFMMNFESVVIDDLLDFFDFLGNDADTSFFIGNFLFENDSANEAASYFKDSADEGNVDAMLKYADMLYEGVGVDIDKESACSYYYKAAEEGNAEAMFKYAKMLNDGDGVEQDKIESLLYFQKSSEKGYEKAKSVLFSDFRLKTNEKIEDEEDKEVKEEENDDDSHIWETDDSEEEDDDSHIWETDDSDEEDGDTVKTFKDSNCLVYKIFMKSRTASIAGAPKDKEEIDVPHFVKYQGQKFDVTAIDDEAFSGSSIEELFIPSSVTTLSANWCSRADKLKKIQVDPGNRFFSIRDGFLISKKLVNDGQEKRKSGEILFAPRDIEGDFSIPDGITRIGNYSFGKREGLVSVASDTPSLQTIDSHAFSGCQNLERLKVCGASDLALCESCFSDSEKLSSVEIESEELNIGEKSFSNCKSLQSVSLTKVDNIVLNSNAFSGCEKLSDFNINDQKKYKAHFVAYSVNSMLFYSSCFNRCAGLVSIFLSDVKEFVAYSHAFQGCPNLDNFVIQNSKKIVIHPDCFFNLQKFKSFGFTADSINLANNFIVDCPSLSLINITSKKDFTITSSALKGLKSLTNASFHTSANLTLCKNCFQGTGLTSADFKAGSLELSDECFNGCSSLINITMYSKQGLVVSPKIIEGLESLSNINIITESTLYVAKEFMNGSANIETVDIQGKKINIGDECFNNCQSLSSFSMSSCGQVTIGKKLFKDCNKLKTISIKSPKGNLFSFDQNLISEAKNVNVIKFAEGAISISKCSFKNCSSLNTLIIDNADSISIDESQFYNCKSLKKIELKSDGDVKLGKSCFQGCSNLEEVDISGSAVTIENFCFHSCSSLTTFNINDAKSATLGSQLFFKCSNLNVIDIKTVDNLIILESCFKGSSVKTATFLSGGDIEIGKEGFIGSPIKSLNIPVAKNLTLRSKAFDLCKDLAKILLNASSKIKVCDSCFYGDKSLKIIDIQGTEIDIERYGFYNCSSITFITIENSDKITFGENSFEGCGNLQKLAINSKLEFSASEKCFSKAYKLQFVNIVSENATIGENCFQNCSAMESVVIISNSDIKLLSSAFVGCSSLKSAKLSATKKLSINDSCFEKLKSLDTVEMKGEEVITGNNCFSKCSSLISLTLLDADKVCFGQRSFEECSSVAVLTINAPFRFHAKDFCFSKMSKLQYVEINSSKVIFDDFCFYKCSLLQNVKCLSANDFLEYNTSFYYTSDKLKVDLKPTAKKRRKASNNDTPKVPFLDL